MATETGLAKYRPVAKPALHGLEGYESAKEFLAQAEALRQDFPLREAKLRQAADIFEDASARADAMFDKLDAKKQSLERSADTAAHARAQAKAILETLEVKHADLLSATKTAYSVRSDADELRQEHQRLGSEIDAARLDLSAFLQDMQTTREELRDLKAQARPFAPSSGAALPPGVVPGDAPGTVSTPPALYPAGITLLSYVQSILVDGATGLDNRLLKTGDTMTGELDITLTSGPSFAFTPTATIRSGAFGLVFDKAKALNTNPHSIIWSVGASPTWEIGQDFDTNNSDHSGAGNSDFITVYDHTANALAGADIMRFSPAEKDSVGSPGSTKMAYGGTGTGTPRTNTMLWQVVAGAGLSGMSMSINSASARDHLILTNAHATSKRAAIDLNSRWYLAVDVAGAGTSEFVIRDKTNSLNRFYIENTAALQAKFGVNTTAPAAYLHSGSSSDASLYNTSQPLLAVGGGTLANRCWNVTQLVDNDGTFPVSTQVWISGTAGSTSTRATPTSTSTNDKGVCWLYDGDTSKFCVAAAGTNQTLLPAINFRQSSSAARISFFTTTPVIQQASAAAATDPASVITLANALRTALLAYGLIA